MSLRPGLEFLQVSFGDEYLYDEVGGIHQVVEGAPEGHRVANLDEALG